MKIALATALAAVCLVGPVTNVQAAERLDSTWTQEDQRTPLARASCPVCPVIVMTAIRVAVVRAAPVAARAAVKIGRGSARTRARVRVGARKSLRWAKKAKRMTAKKAMAVYLSLPRPAQGCGRGLAEHLREVTLFNAFYACVRGIVENYLGKEPFDPLNK